MRTSIILIVSMEQLAIKVIIYNCDALAINESLVLSHTNSSERT